jgi:uncharacterized protein YecT (DUF1311 family)
MRRETFLLVTVLGTMPLICQAKEQVASPHPMLATIDATLVRCKEANPGNIPERVCTMRASEAVDTVLDKLHERIITQLQTSRGLIEDKKERDELLKRLTESQRAWVVYRDADCSEKSGAMLGGSGEASLYEDCLFSMRRDRLNSLFALYKDRFPETGEVNARSTRR